MSGQSRHLHVNASRLLRRALRAHEQGEFGKAERFYTAVLDHQPGNFDALHGLGLIHYRHGRLDSALALIQAALQTDTDRADGFASLGLVFLHTPDPLYRRGTCRALNRANAETFANFSDRLAPVVKRSQTEREAAARDLDHAALLDGQFDRAAEQTQMMHRQVNDKLAVRSALDRRHIELAGRIEVVVV